MHIHLYIHRYMHVTICIRIRILILILLHTLTYIHTHAVHPVNSSQYYGDVGCVCVVELHALQHHYGVKFRCERRHAALDLHN